MTTFLITFTFRDTVDAIELFSTLDCESVQGICVVGSWLVLGESKGYCVCDAESPDALSEQTLAWTSLASVTAVPVVNDGELRSLLGLEEDDEAPHAGVVAAAEATDEDGEAKGVYVITYDLRSAVKRLGFSAYEEVTAPESAGDASVTLIERHHAPASGTGVLVCAAFSPREMHGWLCSRLSPCWCEVRPALRPSDVRKLGVEVERGVQDAAAPATEASLWSRLFRS